MKSTLASADPGAVASESLDSELAAADSRDGSGEYFGEVVRQRLQRRTFLKGVGLGTGAMAVPALLNAPNAEATADPGKRITFTPIAATDQDAVVVPVKYTHNVVIRWGIRSCRARRRST